MVIVLPESLVNYALGYESVVCSRGGETWIARVEG